MTVNGKGDKFRPVNSWKDYRDTIDRVFGEKPLNIMRHEATVDNPAVTPILGDYETVLNRFETNPDGANSWLINEFIPSRGSEHIFKYIDIGFEPFVYMCWLWSLEHPENELSEEIRKTIIQRVTKLRSEGYPRS